MKSLALRNELINQTQCSTSSGPEKPVKLPSPRVPIELIDRIIEFALGTSPSSSTVSDFISIASMSLASVDFRQIFLRRYFRHVILETRSHWKGVFNLLELHEYKSPLNGGVKEGFSWMRSLCAPSTILTRKPTRLNYLTNLRSLSIDFAEEGLSTQYPCIKLLIGNFDLNSLSLKLTSLTLSNLPRIDVLLLKFIAKSFPRLTDLYLSCTERLEFGCCWTCFEESLGCTIHSPIPDDYFDVSDMANAFAGSLKPLACLTHLHLGVFLSDEQLLYGHIAHSLGDEEDMGWIDGSGQYPACFESAVKDVRMRELKASIIIAQKLKAIKSVGWSSFFIGTPDPKELEGNMDEGLEAHVGELRDNNFSSSEYEDNGLGNSEIMNDMKTTVWVLRSNGRVRVRRTPW